MGVSDRRISNWVERLELMVVMSGSTREKNPLNSCLLFGTVTSPPLGRAPSPLCFRCEPVNQGLVYSRIDLSSLSECLILVFTYHYCQSMTMVCPTVRQPGPIPAIAYTSVPIVTQSAVFTHQFRRRASEPAEADEADN